MPDLTRPDRHADAGRPAGSGAAPSGARYGVLGGLCVMATIAYIQRNSIGIAEASIREELNLSKEQMGVVMTAFFATYAIFQIPTGALIGNWGVRRALTAFAIVFSLMSGIFAACGSWFSLVATRLSMGVAQAGIFPASTTSIAQWFPRTERAIPNGALGGFMQIGGAVGAMLTGWLIVLVGWRWTFACYAIPGLAWAVWFYVWFRDTPAEYRSRKSARLSATDEVDDLELTPAPSTSPTPWRILLTNRSMIAICGQQFCRACAAMFFGSWFATYLKETRGVSVVEAGLLTSIPMWSTMLGSFVGGFASDFVLRRTGSLNAARRGIGVWSMAFCSALASLTYLIHDPLLATLLIGGGSFFAAFGGPCAYSITIDVGGRHVPAVFSTMNMVGNIGAAVFPMMVPAFLAATDNWDLVLFLFVGLYVLAGIFWLFTDPGTPIFPDDDL